MSVTWNNPWWIPASKTWTPEEFQLQKHEHLRNSSFKNLNPWVKNSSLKAQKPEPLRNSSLKNLNNPWGIPVSKILTPEEFQPQLLLTPEEFQFQKY